MSVELTIVTSFDPVELSNVMFSDGVRHQVNWRRVYLFRDDVNHMVHRVVYQTYKGYQQSTTRAQQRRLAEHVIRDNTGITHPLHPLFTKNQRNSVRHWQTGEHHFGHIVKYRAPTTEERLNPIWLESVFTSRRWRPDMIIGEDSANGAITGYLTNIGGDVERIHVYALWTHPGEPIERQFVGNMRAFALAATQ